VKKETNEVIKCMKTVRYGRGESRRVIPWDWNLSDTINFGI
jgi:hypothetical protein